MSEVIGKARRESRPVLNAGGFIVCKYTCGLCEINEQPVSVPARTGEDVIEWVRLMMTPALMRDHLQRSPDCHPKEFESVMIPIPPGIKKIGGPVIN